MVFALTFDQKRALTPFEHLVQDDRLGPLHSREGHYRDILHHTADIPEAAMDQQVKHFMDSGYSIHFHVWDYRSLYAFLLHADAYLGNIFTVEEYRRNGEEILCVLRKTPDAALAHKLAGLAQRAPRVDKALPTTGIAKRWLDARHFLNRVYAKLHAFRYYAEVRKRATLRLRRRLNRLIFQA